MSCLAWNYRGIGNLRTKRELVEIVRAKDPSVVFLAQTLTAEVRLEVIRRSIDFDHRRVVPMVGKSGGLVLFWKSSINLKIEGSSKNYINAIIDKNTELE